MPQPNRAPRKRVPKIPCADIPSDVRYTKGGRAKRVYSPQMKRWNAVTERRFLDALAASGNVKWAAKEAGIAEYTPGRHRRNRPEFALKWAAALDNAYAMLEFELVTAARHAISRLDFPAELKIKPMSAADAIRVLSIYKASLARDGRMAGPEALPKDMEDVREEILRKVKAIRNARPPKT